MQQRLKEWKKIIKRRRKAAETKRHLTEERRMLNKHRQTHTYRHTDRQTDRQSVEIWWRKEECKTKGDRHTCIPTCIHTYRHTDRQTDRQTDRETDTECGNEAAFIPLEGMEKKMWRVATNGKSSHCSIHLGSAHFIQGDVTASVVEATCTGHRNHTPRSRIV
jgi:hypothetical protein